MSDQVATRLEQPGERPPGHRHELLALLAYMAAGWPLLVALFACIAAIALLDLLVPWVIGFILIDHVIRQARLGDLWIVPAALIGIFVAQRLFAFLQEYVYELANQRVVHRLRCDLYEHIERLPVSALDRGHTGELLSRVTGDVDTVEGLLDMVVRDIAAEALMFAGALFFLWSINPELTVWVAPTLPALAVSVAWLKAPAKRYARRVRMLIGEMAALAAETLAGIRIVKACAAEEFEARRFAAKSREMLHARVASAKLRAVYATAVDLWVLTGTLIVAVVAAPRVVAGTLTIGALVAYLGYLSKLYGPAKKLSKVNFSIQKILAAADRIFEVLDAPAEVDVVPERLTAAVGPAPSPRGAAVSFDRVTFEYAPGRMVLRDFTLAIAPGELIALVGPSGGGKTTIASLLLRFYVPGGGKIRFDGRPLDHLPLQVLRRQIGVVSQDTFLFSGSIHDNIAYARPDASEADVVEAARVAHAHEFVTRLPSGYQTEVGERGVCLSGGQRQRIAIARALVRNPRLLIFDEATSHLDAESEQLVQDALTASAAGRTVIAIAHRLSTVWRADRIVLIDNGTIVQAGRHEELLAAEGPYRRMVQLQLQPAAVDYRH